MRFIYCIGFLFCAFCTSAQSIVNTSFLQEPDGLPIKPARTISFSTDEVSNTDVSISSDGNQIIFTILGDIFSIPSTGGKAKQLTRGLAMNTNPVWSPDGKLIAYQSDASGVNAIELIEENGKYVGRLTKATAPRFKDFNNIQWTPDGSAVLASWCLYYLIGGFQQFPFEAGNVIGFAKNDSTIFTISDDQRVYTIFSLNRYSQEKIELFSFTRDYGLINNPRVSPDGKWLTYMTGDFGKSADSLIVCNLITGQRRLLTQLNIKYAGPIFSRSYSFSADSKNVFIGYNGKIHRISIETGANDIIPFEAEVNVDLGPLNYHTFLVKVDSLESKYIRYAQRSPDGRHLIFQALSRIYIQDLPGGHPRILINQPFGQFQPAYSPDGKWIVYTSWNDQEGGHVWRVNALGGKPEQLTTTPGQYHQPCLSPDNKMVVVAKGGLRFGDRDNPGIGEILLIDIKSQKTNTLAKGVPLLNKSLFTKDGTQVMYNPGPGKDNNVVVALTPPIMISRLLDSSNSKVIVKGNLGDHSFGTLGVRKMILSPNQKYVVYTYAESLFLAPQVNLGFPATIIDDVQPLPVIRFAHSGNDPQWENGGELLSWSFANKYYAIDPDKILQAAMLYAKRKMFDVSKMRFIDVEIKPDIELTVTLNVEKDYGKGTVVLKNARIITMEGDKVIEKGNLIINNGRITILEEGDEISIPKGAKVIDLIGKTIMPGLIDLHAHHRVPPEILPQQSWIYNTNLAFGVTTALDVSSSHDMFGYSELIETGQMAGPREFTVGPAIRSDRYAIFDFNEAQLIVKNRKAMGATEIKEYAQPTRIQRQWLLQASREVGLNMTNEVNHLLLNAISMVKDGSTAIEHNPYFGEVYKDVITLFTKSGTFLDPVIQASYSRRHEQQTKYYFFKKYNSFFIDKLKKFYDPLFLKYALEDVEESNVDTSLPYFLPEASIDARIYKNGGNILMGSHGEHQGVGSHFETWALQMGGLSNLEALKIATIDGARGIGVQNDLGSIKEGKIADLLILDKDPLKDIHNTLSIKYVMKSGVLYEGETLNTIWPVKKKFPNPKLKMQEDTP